MSDNLHVQSTATSTQRLPSRVEWPTVVVAIGIWTLWAALVFAHRSIPWPVSVVGLAIAGGWYMSLQHEVIHGHPTPWRAANLLLAAWPIHLWLPYQEYRDSHLEHHEIELTVPGVDPESYYVSPQDWARSGRLRRTFLKINRTYMGRVIVGPLVRVPTYVAGQLRRATGDRVHRRIWLVHLVAAVVVGWLVFGVAGMPVWEYLVGFVWLGLSLTYTRSFLEHRAVADPAQRTAFVQSGRLFGLLFLFNNLHVTHHARPGVAWYRLPELSEELGSAEIARQGAGYYRTYREVIRRYAFRPFDVPVHPVLGDAAAAGRDA